jgi:N utilization substance protein B
MKTSADLRYLHRLELIQHLYASAMTGNVHPTVSHIWQQLGLIDSQIELAAPQWPLKTSNPVVLAILRLATFELLVDKTAPYKVIIDEAVEAAKAFASESSPAFVNGVLGKIVKTNHL